MEAKGNRVSAWVESMVRRDRFGRFSRQDGGDRKLTHRRAPSVDVPRHRIVGHSPVMTGRGERDGDDFDVAVLTPLPGFARHVGEPWDGGDWADVRIDRDFQMEVGAAYDDLPERQETALPSFNALLEELDGQYRTLTEELGITVEAVAEDPYPDVEAMVADLRDNKRMRVLDPGETPQAAAFDREDVIKFRAVHDAFGHAGTGRGFDRHGEEAAFQAHANMFSLLARPALASLTRGQNASLIRSGEETGTPRFPDQKIAVLPPALGGEPDVDVPNDRYLSAFRDAMQGNPRTRFVNHYTSEEMADADMTSMVLPDGASGMVVVDHGDGRIEGSALFTHPDHKGKKTGAYLINRAIREGRINYGECYGEGLLHFYEGLGFVKASQDPFNPEYADPDWDYERDNHPNYYTMKVAT